MLDKTYNPAGVEEKLYKQWEEGGVFRAHVGSGQVPYTIMMPPPNVTGSLHIGHALTFTLQDILTRYHRMTGRDTLWQPGTDHAGIATQMVVERNLEKDGISRHDLGRQGFLEKVWEWKEQSGGTIVRQLRRLGASPDWSRERFTMDAGLSEAVRTIFVKLHKDGLIYRAKRLVNWDPKLHTAISDLEVEQREIKGKMWYLRYPVDGMDGTFITVATTRPETMLGDTGVAVHPDDTRYAHLIGKQIRLPVTGRLIPIIADEHADPEKGTGAVKITPAHDFNDFDVGKRSSLNLVNVFDRDARILAEPTPLLCFVNGQAQAVLNSDGSPALVTLPAAFHGLDRFVARDKILEILEAQGLLERIEENPMTVPYGDRSGVVIEPWLTDQWFVDAPKLAKGPIEAVETGRTVFAPRQWENTFFEWMRNIQPWCVSRQLWWGHQIPAWFGPDGTPFVEMSEEEARSAAEGHYGHPVDLVRDPDVLDTWFSSALWPFSTLGWPEKTPELARYYPGDVLVTGFDIIFFWVARMMMFGMYIMDDVPFRDVYIHALVRDEKGQKMSKSKGNVMDPLDLIDRYGTDALRFTLAAMAAQGRDIKMSEQRIAGYRNFATKLWNAARFCQMNACHGVEGFDPSAVKHTLARWIVGKLAETSEKVSVALSAYRFNDAANAAYQFTWGTFCDWYLEFAKPIFNGNDPATQAEIRAVTAWVLDQILIILHPFMPFITETLWAETAERSGMLALAQWSGLSGLDQQDAREEMDWVVDCISAIRSVRSEMNVPPSARLPILVKDASLATQERLKTHQALIQALARLEDVKLVNQDDISGAARVVIGEITVIIPLEGIIDLSAEKARLTKELDKLDLEIRKLAGRLDNQAFVAKAPVEVVDEQKARIRDLQATKAKMQEALGCLLA
ncbi:valine--tRNA ligase [Haematospirillum jordaniae]|uniref:Valine--tRNA ligase n=1 Tax=Haematospirillum jordaniae TaxID=1549855 RepID=A0A143DEU2_9PROT|nr:valine--tRNA ligase [Haematospirillum jordaniae]AMW35186.1 valine--tRNA ligase [Haematospirillum jordaniae]NKD46064.1 valine--tRNA ligase [Haematospirillum jordaniae]NKD56418.1 valine--tRNA ligase [Haematospirillum jordaniae]NKD58476.1 valine--tRNA ligase [Haematospirillum jordaniae]NKD66355.1 valine--tRNA ligase [Haematospirillum jordaniae]